MEYTISDRNWLNIKLGDFAERITKGGTPTTYGYSFQETGINFIKVENVKNGNINIQSITDFITAEAHAFQNKSQLSEGNILFSIAGTIGETCIVKKEHLPANTNQALAIIKGTSKYIIPSLLKYQLDAFVAKVKAKARGGAMNNVSLDDLKSLFVNIPPPNEQFRLLAKIEELFSSLDKGIESLKTSQQQLKVYRHAVLKWAFEGKLTNKNVVEGKLPDGWKLVKFIDFCKLQRGYDLPLKKISEGNYPVVTSSGVNGYHNVYKANGPCLITGRSGGVGNIHYLDVEKYWPHNTVLFVKDFCNNYPKYVYYYFLQFNFKGFSASTTIPTLDRKQLYNELVCLPPHPEQHAIVAEIESRLSVSDKIEESIEHSLKQSEALRQSILKKAFEGKLVPQDPNDESASVLLDRIRRERSETPSSQTKTRSRK